MPRHHYDADGKYRGYSLTDEERDQERIAAEQEWTRRQDPAKDARYQRIFNWGCTSVIALIVLGIAIHAPDTNVRQQRLPSIPPAPNSPSPVQHHEPQVTQTGPESDSRRAGSSGGESIPVEDRVPTTEPISPAPITGTVVAIDMQARSVRLLSPDGASYTVTVEATTPVYFNGQEYRCSNLEPGDLVRAVYGSSTRLRFDVLRSAPAR